MHVGDEADACGKKRPATIHHGKFISLDARPVHSGFFKNIPTEYRHLPATTRVVVPRATDKAFLGLERFKALDDPIAQVLQKRNYFLSCIHICSYNVLLNHLDITPHE